MTPAGALAAGIAELGLDLDPVALASLHAYLVLLDKWNRTHNLTAIRDPGQMVTHHLLDCLAVLPHLQGSRELRVVDIGSGGGFPGIPIAIARGDWRITLLDSNHKKAAFLRQAAVELPLPNVEVVVARAEDYVAEELFDVAISRAFADLATFATAGGRLLAPGGRLIAMKGVYPNEEIDQLPTGIRIHSVPQLKVPGLAGTRHVVMMERAGS